VVENYPKVKGIPDPDAKVRHPNKSKLAKRKQSSNDDSISLENELSRSTISSSPCASKAT